MSAVRNPFRVDEIDDHFPRVAFLRSAVARWAMADTQATPGYVL